MYQEKSKNKNPKRGQERPIFKKSVWHFFLGDFIISIPSTLTHSVPIEPLLKWAAQLVNYDFEFSHSMLKCTSFRDRIKVTWVKYRKVGKDKAQRPAHEEIQTHDLLIGRLTTIQQPLPLDFYSNRITLNYFLEFGSKAKSTLCTASW